MRLEFIFLIIGLGVLFKYASFCWVVVYIFLIFLYYISNKKYFYILCLIAFVIRLYFLEEVSNKFVQSGVYEGYVCGFESNFDDFKYVDFCINNGQKISLKVPNYTQLEYGGNYQVNITCQLIESKYKEFYLIRSIANKCNLINYQQYFGTNFLYKLLNILYQLRLYAEKKLFSTLHYPVADLSAGLLYGFRANFDEFFKFNFTTLGLTHLIAISGYNVSLFLLLVDKVFAYVNRKKRMYIYPFCLLVFVFLTGMQGSVIRACLMAQIQLLALRSERHYSALDALIVVIFLFLFINPYQVYYDIGLWLSFLSTFAIVVFSPYVLHLLSRYIKSKLILESVVLTTISFFATYLVSDLFFDNVNLFSIIPNLLVAPIVGVLMIIIFQYVFLSSSLFADIYIFVIHLLVDVFVLILNFSVFLNYFILDFFF